MRKLIVTIFLLAAYACQGQVFPTDTVVKKGALNKRINFVYLSDGYLPGELNTFATDVTTINNKLFLTTPFKEYINYFNIFQVRVPSAESGAKHSHSASDCPDATFPFIPITRNGILVALPAYPILNYLRPICRYFPILRFRT